MADERPTATKKTAKKKSAPAAAVAKKVVTRKAAAKKAATKKTVPAAPAASASPTAPAAPRPAPAATPATPAAPRTKPAAPVRGAAPKPADRPALPPVSADERRHMIEEAAYFRAEARGFAPGFEEEDWAASEKFIDDQLKEQGRL
jgi:hypothetical protein